MSSDPLVTSANSAANVAPKAQEIRRETSHFQNSQALQAKTEQPTALKLQAAVEKINKVLSSEKTSLNFSVDTSSDQVVIRGMDTETDELIRQIPNEEAIRLAEHIEGMMGIIFRREA